MKSIGFLMIRLEINGSVSIVIAIFCLNSIEVSSTNELASLGVLYKLKHVCARLSRMSVAGRMRYVFVGC